jgi:hypothetical protein
MSETIHTHDDLKRLLLAPADEVEETVSIRGINCRIGAVSDSMRLVNLQKKIAELRHQPALQKTLFSKVLTDEELVLFYYLSEGMVCPKLSVKEIVTLASMAGNETLRAAARVCELSGLQPEGIEQHPFGETIPSMEASIES